MKQSGKVFSLCLLILCLITIHGRLGPNQTVHADTSSVEVKIHKLAFPDGTKLPDIVNDGQEVDTNGQPKKDVIFKVYNVTKEYWKQYQIDHNQSLIQERLANESARFIKRLKPVKTMKTNTDGIASFHLLKGHVYLFVEEKPTDVQQAQNIVLPISNVYQETVYHLYPKNLLNPEKIKDMGEKKFVKVDLKTQNPLAGAKFVISRSDGKILTDDNKWVDVKGNLQAQSSKYNLKILTSHADGEFQIDGLKVGIYSLYEIEAPKGYELLTHSISFEVVAGEYKDSGAVPYKVFNQKVGANKPDKPGSIDHVVDKPTQSGGGILGQIIQKVLPQTGEAKGLAGVGILLILISIGYFIFIKQRRRNENE